MNQKLWASGQLLNHASWSSTAFISHGQGTENRATKVGSLIGDPLPSRGSETLPASHFHPIGQLIWNRGKKQIKISTLKRPSLYVSAAHILLSGWPKKTKAMTIVV